MTHLIKLELKKFGIAQNIIFRDRFKFCVNVKN